MGKWDITPRILQNGEPRKNSSTGPYEGHGPMARGTGQRGECDFSKMREGKGDGKRKARNGTVL